VLGCALAATLFLSPALFTGRWFSPADLLYNLLPWSTAAPPDWPGAGNQNLSDVVLTFEPWLAYSAQRLHAGALPLWDPYNMLGAPLLGNMQSAVFYPPNWFYFLWPGGEMLVLLAWLKLFIAALGRSALARQVGRGGPPSPPWRTPSAHSSSPGWATPWRTSPSGSPGSGGPPPR
jgi:hypothetical protein